MQCSVVFAVLVAALAIAHAKIDHEQNEKYFNECKEKTGAEENYEDIVKKDKIPTSDKGMCLLECVMEKKNVYGPDGKYNPEGAKEHFTKIFEGHPEVLKKALDIVKQCSEIDIEGLDKCEAAVKHTTCAKTKFAQENINLKDY